MPRSTGSSQGSAQAVEEELSYCLACGGTVYATPVRLTGGTYQVLEVEMVPWQGDATRLRLSRDRDGGWFVDPHAGPWQEHRCGGL